MPEAPAKTAKSSKSAKTSAREAKKGRERRSYKNTPEEARREVAAFAAKDPLYARVVSNVMETLNAREGSTVEYSHINPQKRTYR